MKKITKFEYSVLDPLRRRRSEFYLLEKEILKDSGIKTIKLGR
ncbi:MAG: hypothetical protein PF692_07690 [Kiritimatiellae bacterium]|jgi:hypothetical protein|nr:hypothetical protein [Kiritimatiellia bacterium]